MSEDHTKMTCCVCDCTFWMPVGLYKRAKADPDILFYCPYGHTQHYTGRTEVDILKGETHAANRRLEKAERQRDEADRCSREKYAKIEYQERRIRGYKGMITRLQNALAKEKLTNTPLKMVEKEKVG